MKHLFIYLFILCLIQPVLGKKVEEKDILEVVKKVLKDENKDYKNVEELIPSGLENDTTIYIAKLKGGGFIVISADDIATPILVINSEAQFVWESLPPGLSYLLGKYQYSIKELKDNKKEATDKVKERWKYYLDESNVATLKSSNILLTGSVAEMITTEWYQYGGYNFYCPSGCAAGCTAVALARILYYWRAGVIPQGSNTHDGQTADFESTDYHWCDISETSSDIYNKKLIYHAGISCNTNYCCWGGSGSCSTTLNAAQAFRNYWGMNAIEKERIFNLNTWEDMMIDELDNGRPILYGGGPLIGSGHSWVIDGYKSTGEFSCKWGYGSNYDSYCYLGDFDPPSGTGPYNNYEDAVFGVYPKLQSGNIIGPSTLTGTPVAYTVSNPKPNAYITWTHSSNIATHYGGNNWIALKATSSGTGWIEASYVLCGSTVAYERFYVNLNF